ncbi:hypothetical protein Tco_1249654 [Tanacetum coccineum]
MDHNSLIYFQFVYRHGIHGLYDEKILEKLVLAYGRLNMAKGGATSIVSVGLKLGLMSPSLCTHVGRCLALNGEAQEAAYFYRIMNKKLADYFYNQLMNKTGVKILYLCKGGHIGSRPIIVILQKKTDDVTHQNESQSKLAVEKMDVQFVLSRVVLSGLLNQLSKRSLGM